MPKPLVASRRDAMLLTREIQDEGIGRNTFHDPRVPQAALTGLRSQISRSLTPFIGSTRKKLGLLR